MLSNDFFDGVGTTERSNDSAFLKRICLRADTVLYGFGLTGRYRPLRHIPPIIILSKIGIHVQRVAILLFKYELAEGQEAQYIMQFA